MRPETRLESAVFQLTPTRTRCDLVVVANGRKEKIASGLLNPFIAHLKVAQEQIAKGGYSITLEPDPEIDASWFTRGTVERLVLGFSSSCPVAWACHPSGGIRVVRMFGAFSRPGPVVSHSWPAHSKLCSGRKGLWRRPRPLRA